MHQRAVLRGRIARSGTRHGLTHASAGLAMRGLTARRNNSTQHFRLDRPTRVGARSCRSPGDGNDGSGLPYALYAEQDTVCSFCGAQELAKELPRTIDRFGTDDRSPRVGLCLLTRDPQTCMGYYRSFGGIESFSPCRILSTSESWHHHCNFLLTPRRYPQGTLSRVSFYLRPLVQCGAISMLFCCSIVSPPMICLLCALPRGWT